MSLTPTLIKQILQKNPQNFNELMSIVRSEIAKLHAPLPTKAELLHAYRELLASKEILPNKNLENILKTRKVRTLSGVAPITVMTAPMSCPNRCLYCPTEVNMPKSYLSNQPAAMRAVLAGFDPFIQTQTRLKALKENGHSTDKIEIIINGGTWSHHPKYYQTWYIKRIFEACNYYGRGNTADRIKYQDVKKAIQEKLSHKIPIEEIMRTEDDSKIMAELMKEQLANETAENRIIGITLETRPDFITPEEIKRMRMLGGTKVEIGVQNIYPEILELNRRGHGIKEVIRATKLLKDAGFKVAYHIMPAMFGSSPEKDIQMSKDLFSKPDFKPDFLKIYPCVVVKDSDLYEIFKMGKFIPYSTEILIDTLIKIKQEAPRYCRIARITRDIPQESIMGGCTITNLREVIQKKMEKRKIKCECIRCREAKDEEINPENIKLNIIKFEASGATEYFLTFDSLDGKTLYAFLRLRLPNQSQKEIWETLPELKDAGMVRELHTYGKLMPLKTHDDKNAQHSGFGKRLMAEAENIARENGIKKMAVISGVGVREYYAKIGYRKEGTYMSKQL